jgi:hypothetical protein
VIRSFGFDISEVSNIDIKHHLNAKLIADVLCCNEMEGTASPLSKNSYPKNDRNFNN